MATMYAALALEAITKEMLEPFQYAILEKPDDVVFEELDGICELIAEYRYPRGVAFGEDGEMRWLRRSSGKIHAVWVRDTGPRPDEADREMTLRLADEQAPGSLILWGEREADGHYYEGRIPAGQTYPKAPGDGRRLAVTIRDYESEDGSRRLFRLTGLEPVE